MPIPTTSIGLSSIQTEFGGANPISVSEYYRGAGGGYVLVGQTTSATDGTAISTTGTIRVGMFRGLTKTAAVSGTVRASGASVYSANSIEYLSAASNASISFNSDGTVTTIGSNSTTNPSGWFTPTNASAGTLYWIRATLTSGAVTGTFGSWLPLTSNRAYSVSRSTVGTTSGAFTAELASNATGTTIVASYTNCALSAQTLSSAAP